MGRSHVMAHAEQANPSPLCNTRCRTYPDISGHIRTARHRRAKKGRRVRYRLSPDHVRSCPSRAKGAGAGSRAVKSVVCERSRCRIACRKIGRVRKEPVPDRARSGEPHAHHRPCPGPTWRCSRRRHRRFANVYSFTWPWRFIVVRSAARLSAIVGPLSPRYIVPNRPGSRRDRTSPRINGYNRA